MKTRKLIIFFLMGIFGATESFTQRRFDVIIVEILADPSPVIGLPNQEYIEVKNRSGKDINLQGFRLETATSSSAPFPSYLLPADSLLIITSTGGSSLLAAFGKVLGLSLFPSLNNNGATLRLMLRDTIIHAVPYSITWYDDPKKDDGGWSLEMIDPDNPCTGAGNWKGSIDPKGGTPGSVNSVAAKNEDRLAPELANAFMHDERTIVIQFDEPLDSHAAINPMNYSISPSIGITSVHFNRSRDNEVQLQLSASLQGLLIYTVSVRGVKDCVGNELIKAEIKTGLPQPAAKRDIVINEILFNPKPSSFDFVELYNRSAKIIDAGRLFISNPNAGGNPGTRIKLSEGPRYLFPGDYLLLTENEVSLERSYFVKNKSAVLTMSSLPSLPDDKGMVVLWDSSGNIDELSYDDNWHFSLISDDEGVSLERIDPDGETGSSKNWHSAATSVGYATPTYKNSQYKKTERMDAGIVVTTKIFSPDNDGTDDQAIIQYVMEEGGYVANLKIFDVSGREVRHLVKNNLLGLKGAWTWDGLNEKGGPLPVGPYIIFTEVFNLQGNKKSSKSVVVLARRLN